ncbi:MAG: pirin family protein [Cyclobacteriaceae bacterium]
MSAIKTIKQVIPSQKVNMGGHILDQPLPARGIEHADPFLLIHHWISVMPGNERQEDVGVGIHPHRGFSPVTFVYKGDVQHRDSLGNNAIVEEGGTQWMFAGKGITHSERPSKAMAEKGGDMEFTQFWVNAPAKNKMDEPFYKPISKEETPTITEGGTSIQIVCGQYQGVKGNITYYSPLLLLRVTMSKSDSTTLHVEKNHTTIIYLLDGGLTVNGNSIKGKDMILFHNDGTEIEVTATANTRFIVLSGEPINEPIVSYGPFVMNTEQEIMQTLDDSKKGKLGILIEDFN